MENTLVNSTMSNQTQIVNYALNGKLLDTQESGRSLVVTPAGNNSGALSLPIILVLIFIMASIVGIIVTALFVMRRRFSTWRLTTNDTKEVDAETGTKVETKECEKDVKAEEATTAVKTETETAAPTVDTNQEGDEQKQASPSSNAPLIAESGEAVTEAKTETAAETKTEEAETKVEETQAPVKPTEQVTSSSSLIVNVLNELSESVACKLAGEVAPVTEEEKEPLNSESTEAASEKKE